MKTPKAVEAEATALVAALTAELAGAYSLGEILGTSIGGVTIRASDMSGRDVALKVAWDNPEARERVSREANLTAKVVHPNVLPLRQLSNTKSLVVVEMPLLTGRTIGALLDMQTPVPYAGVVELLRALAGALDQAHSAGIAHGGLRPEAIHINTAGKPVLTDFGLQIPPVLDSRTARPSVIGTAAYMSVEQRHDDPATDGRADQYALAVIAYELLRGARTWRVNSDGVLEIDPVEVMLNRPIAPGVPVAAGMAIRRASSRDANYRYPTIGDFLRAFEGEKPAEASTAEPLYHEQVVVTQRHSRLWLAVPALLVLGVGFSTQPTVRTGFVRLWHGEWPFAKAEYTSETSVDAPARRENSKVATTETRGGTEKGDTSRGQPRTKVGDGTSTLPQTPEQGRGADPYPREQAGAARATPNTQQGGTSSRVNPPKSEPAIVGAAPGKGDRGGDNGRPGQSAAASNGNRDSLVRSRVSSIAVALEGGGRAIVVIDNQARGVTPLLWQGTPGQHVVALRGVTATPSSISINATAGDTVRAVFTRSRP